MKRVLIIVFTVFTMLSVSNLFADNIGCGLGRLAMQGQQGKVFEILGVTTNNTFNTSTFAITSGTSGYKDGEVIGVNYVNAYVAQNMDNLATDIAKGDGEYLNTLATLMKIENKQAFKDNLNKNFCNIFTSKDITSDEVVANIYKIKNS